MTLFDWIRHGARPLTAAAGDAQAACGRCDTGLAEGAQFCGVCGASASGGTTHVSAGAATRPMSVGASSADEAGSGGSGGSGGAAEVSALRDRLARVLKGRYRVGELLGAGGMGAVFMAEDLTLERTVAIKVLLPDVSRDPKAVERFRREAKTAAKLDHPHIIPIHRVETEEGLDYFVMKHVKGRSLESAMEAGVRVPLPFAKRVLAEAASALGHAHKRGVVHRDVKPANILLDGDDRVVLTDFGISKVSDVASRLTEAGTSIGTPHYVAPEQALGASVDGRADQYALAVVAYQMLTGRLLFDGGSAHAIVYRHVNEAVRRVSTIRPDVPPRMDAAIARALSKAPSNRFETMEDFVAAMEGSARPIGAGVTREAPVAAPPTTVAPMTTGSVRTALASERRGRSMGGGGGRRPGGRRVALWLAALVVGGGGVVAARGAGVTSAADARRELERWAARATTAVPGAGTAPSPGTLWTPSDPSRAARLVIASVPRATVVIDGVEVGQTPMSDRMLAVGRTYVVRLDRRGYETKRDVITVKSKATIHRHYVLDPLARP